MWVGAMVPLQGFFELLNNKMQSAWIESAWETPNFRILFRKWKCQTSFNCKTFLESFLSFLNTMNIISIASFLILFIVIMRQKNVHSLPLKRYRDHESPQDTYFWPRAINCRIFTSKYYCSLGLLFFFLFITISYSIWDQQQIIL